MRKENNILRVRVYIRTNGISISSSLAIKKCFFDHLLRPDFMRQPANYAQISDRVIAQNRGTQL